MILPGELASRSKEHRSRLRWRFGGVHRIAQAFAARHGPGIRAVQHLDPQHESALRHLLTRATSLPVREVMNNLRVEANHVYIIPPNTNLGVAQGVLKLQPRQQTRAPQRSIDFF
jgi:chemotaxis response regulator CheB